MAPKTATPTTRKPAGKGAPARSAARPAQGLTPSVQRFVGEYLIDLNATQAYLRAFPGVKNTTARTEGSKLLAKPDVADAIAAAQQERAARTGITADRVLQEVWAIVTADPRELMEYRVGCCRHCWGEGHGYQRTQAEYDRDLATWNQLDAIEREKAGDFDPMGGVGYLRAHRPNADCPECSGEGIGRTVFKDTRFISPAAASLFAGIKESKEGLEIKTHSKDSFVEKAMRHLGLFEKDNKTVPVVVVKDMTGRKSA